MRASKCIFLFAFRPRAWCACAQVAETPSRLTLWYDQPGTAWTHATPIGNGRLGAMMFGDPANEVLDLNEDTVWSGGPHDYTHVGAVKHLAELRRLIREEKYDEAAKIGAEHMMGVPRPQQGYQSLGELHLRFPGHESYTNYHRQLHPLIRWSTYVTPRTTPRSSARCSRRIRTTASRCA